MRTLGPQVSVRRLTIFMVLACLILSSCIFDPRFKETEGALNLTVAELPAPIELQFIGEVPVRAYPSVIDASECTYAEYFRAYGTNLTSEQALNLYAKQLEKLNWQEQSRTHSSRFLARGNSETLDMATSPMSGWYVSELDPNNRRANYPTVLHFRLFIALPQRDGC